MSELSIEETTTKTYRATKRLFVDKERERIVEESDPEAAFLLAAEGQEVSEEDARRYGLLKDEGSEPDDSASDAVRSDTAEPEREPVEVKREEPAPIAKGPAPKAAQKAASKKK